MPRRVDLGNHLRSAIMGYMLQIWEIEILCLRTSGLLKIFPSDTERTRVKNLCQVMHIDMTDL